MAEFNGIFRIIRMVVFGVSSFLAFIALILGGLVTRFFNKRHNVDEFIVGPPALTIATGLLTLLSLPVMLSSFCKGVTSMIVVEFAWISFLWIMWIAVGGSSLGVFPLSCQDYGTLKQAACMENIGITAMAFLIWFFLLSYKVTLSVLAFRQYLRGNTRVWVMDVTETDFASAGNTTTKVVYDGQVNPTYDNQYLPGIPVPLGQPQVVYPQQQVASPNPQSQPGSFAPPQPQTQPGANPYPQV